jgi:hypothetical protein
LFAVLCLLSAVLHPILCSLFSVLYSPVLCFLFAVLCSPLPVFSLLLSRHLDSRSRWGVGPCLGPIHQCIHMPGVSEASSLS